MKSRRIIATIVVGALLTTVTSPIYSQESLFGRLKSGVSKATPDIFKAGQKLKELLAPAADLLKEKTSSTISAIVSKLKSTEPSAIIPKLQDALQSFALQVGTISQCMMGTGECSSKERATFIGAAVVILALTTLLVGYTITVATTSQEVEREVQTVSQEVQGWQPRAIFVRLSNTVNEFSATLDSMKTCLINRSCTKNQKKLLYAAAATIAALTTIAVGIGVGSYIYAEKKRTQEAAKEELIEEALNSAMQPTTTKSAFELPDFDALGQSIKGKISGWQQMVQEKLPVINSDTLKSAYQEIKNQIATGAIKAKDSIATLYEKALERTKGFPALLQETLGVNLSGLNNLFQSFKENMEQFTRLITEDATIIAFSKQVAQMVSYFNNLDNEITKARLAWKQHKFGVFKAKITSPEKYVEQREELDDEYQKVTSEKKAAERELASAIESNPAATQKKNKLLDILKKDPLAELKKEIETLGKKQIKLETERKELTQMQDFDQFVSRKNLEKIYTDIVRMFNNLHLKAVGTFSQGLLNTMSNLAALCKSIHEKAGAVGLILVNDKLNGALTVLQASFRHLGQDLKMVASHEGSLIFSEDLNLGQIVKVMMRAVTKDSFSYLRKNKAELKDFGTKVAGIVSSVKNIKSTLADFNATLRNLTDDTKNQFKEALNKSPLAVITAAPAVLRLAFATVLEKTKKSLDSVLENTSSLLSNIVTVVSPGFAVIQDLNERIGELTDRLILNRTVFEDALPILNSDIPNIAEGVRALKAAL